MDDLPVETRVLLARHQAGDAAALATLITRYYPRIERLVRARLGPTMLVRASIGDYVQDVMVQIVQSAGQFQLRSDAHWIDYVAGMAENAIKNHARRDRAQKRGGRLAQQVRQYAESSLAMQMPADTTDVPGKASRREVEQRMDACVSRLSPAHREVVMLRRYVGYDWPTIAEQLGRTSPEACQELFRRAQEELRALWIEGDAS